MFTGIITDVGRVKEIQKNDDGARLVIECHFDVSTKDIGASIACNGCCLTVVEKGDDWFAVDVSNETLDKTNIGRWIVDTKVNLEQSLKMGDELGGHIVSGHVDGPAVIDSITQDGDSYRLTLSVSGDLAGLIAPKGSVTLDGISLTVNEVQGKTFGVNIIPHTWGVTNLQDCKQGDVLNLEIDVLARYVARLLSYNNQAT